MGNPDSNSKVDSKEKDGIVVPRENLITQAVNFMLNKKIRDQDPLMLRQFLIKKGLTEAETAIVFQRFEAQKNQNGSVFNQPMYPAHLLASVPGPPPPPSLWITVHRVVTTVTSIGGIVYAVYWLWKTYISPYLFGRRPKRKPVEQSLEELGAAVSGCAEDLRTLRSTVNTLAADKVADVALTSRLHEIKSEVSSLKSLLLNRNQFPATPTPGPLSIPAWQLGAETHSRPETETEAEGEGEEEGEGSNGGTNGSDSSLEIVKCAPGV